MHGLAQFVLASVALMSLATASPFDKRVETFTVEQKLNTKFVRNGPAAYAKAYKKFGKPLPKDLAAATDDGTVTASPEDAYDSEYLCPVTVGGQTLNLDFDTGSADLYLFLDLFLLD